MSKTTEEKIDEMHTMLLELKGDFKGFKAQCDLKHTTLDDRVEDLDHELNGNGKPGLAEKHQTLANRFNMLEIRLYTVTALLMLMAQVYGDKIKQFLGN